MQETSVLWDHTHREAHISTSRPAERDRILERLHEYGHAEKCEIEHTKMDGEWDTMMITGPIEILRRAFMSIATPTKTDD